jgi:NAD(P)H dehydrogenase (quinone)
MKLLVTGATGKFGTKVMEILLKTVPAESIGRQCSQPRESGSVKGSWRGSPPRGF